MTTFFDRGKLAQTEHDKKLREYLKDNLDQLVQKQKLMKNGKVQTDLSTLELPTLRYGSEEKEELGKGSGEGGEEGDQKGQKKQGKEGDEGDQTEKVDVTGRLGADEHSESQKVELDFEEFVRIAQEQLIDELDLPRLNPPRLEGSLMTEDEIEQMDIDRLGVPSDIHLEETMFESLKRNIRDRGVMEYDVDIRKDGWYFSDTPQMDKTNKALEVYLLDISGSVSGHNIALIRKFIFILWYYLDQQYSNNTRRFIVFQDAAEEINLEEFFCIESRGGTHISSGFTQALTDMETYAQYDKFLFFFSDGDNSSSDDDTAKKLFDEVLSTFDLFCYGRINPCDSPVSPFNKLVRGKIKDKANLTFTDIRNLDNVKETLKSFLKLLYEGKTKKVRKQ